MDKEHVWTVYFASVVSMSLHPGAGLRGHQRLNLDDCARLCDRMLDIHFERFPEIDDVRSDSKSRG